MVILFLFVKAVDRFVVGREDLGEVQFLLPVDLVRLDLDRIIDIEKGKIQVYGLEGEAKAPSLGQGLNVPAMLVFRYRLLLDNACSFLGSQSMQTVLKLLMLRWRNIAGSEKHVFYLCNECLCLRKLWQCAGR